MPAAAHVARVIERKGPGQKFQGMTTALGRSGPSLGNEVTAETESAFRGTARPNGLQINPHRREDRNMKNCKNVLGELFGLL